LKSGAGNWDVSEQQLLDALEKLKNVKYPAIWKSAIEQSLNIHR
jgi:hypothetical protein